MPADTGSPWNIPYPVSSDAPDDPGQSRARAEKIAGHLTTLSTATIVNATTTVTTTPYNITSTDDVIIANVNNGTINLPAVSGSPGAAGSRGRQYTVKNIHTSVLTVKAGATIEGTAGATGVRMNRWHAATFHSDGTVWFMTNADAIQPGSLVGSFYASTTQSFTSGIGAEVTLAETAFDVYGVGLVTGGPIASCRYIPPREGWYEVSGEVTFAGNATGQRQAVIFVSGAGANGGANFVALAGAATPLAMPLPAVPVYLNGTTDYVSIYAMQASGGALATYVSGGARPAMRITYVAAGSAP